MQTNQTLNTNCLSSNLRLWDNLKTSKNVKIEDIECLVNKFKETTRPSLEHLSRTKQLNIATIQDAETNLSHIRDTLLNTKKSPTIHKDAQQTEEQFQQCLQNIDFLKKDLCIMHSDFVMHGIICSHFTQDLHPKDSLGSKIRNFLNDLLSACQLKTHLNKIVVSYLFNPPSSLAKKIHLQKSLAKLKESETELTISLQYIQAKLEKKPSDDNLRAKASKLEQRITDKKYAVKECEEKLQKQIKNFAKGNETKQCFHQLGGEALKIKLPNEDVTLDGMYVSADSFRKTIKEQDGKLFTFQYESNEVGTKEVKGFSFAKDAFD
ncbi:MAG: hypothetical protein H0W88_09950 [Parachlamydiaceae bacterium]|nr:hypothetical protein [Parachlamydiaceae bacterium]